jgi:hypothetical protein
MSVEAFCQSRETNARARREGRQERAEVSAAHRAVGAMLRDSMVRNNVECIEVGGGSERSFVRMSTPSPRVPPVKEAAQIAELVAGIGSVLEGVPAEALPRAATRFLADRMKSRTTAPGEPRIAVVRRAVKDNTVSLSRVPREVRALTEDFVTHHAAKTDAARELRPLHAAVQQHERDVLQAYTEPVSVRLRTEAGDVDCRVVRCERKVSRRARPLGLRAILSLGHDVAARLATRATTGGADKLEEEFGRELAASVEDKLRSTTGDTAANAPQHYLKVVKLGRAAPA